MGTVTQIYSNKRRSKAKPKIGLFLILFFVAILSIYYFIHSSFFALKEIQVTGCESLKNEYIIEQSGFSHGTNIFKLEVAEGIEKIKLHPLVGEVDIKYNLPSKVSINIKERDTTALVVIDDGFIEVSEEGYFLKKNQGLNLKGQRLPLITGTKTTTNLVPGSLIENHNVQNALRALKALDTSVKEIIIEINVSNPNNIILMLQQGIEIRVGTVENIKAKNATLKETISKLTSNFSSKKIEYIDLRYNTSPVVKTK